MFLSIFLFVHLPSIKLLCLKRFLYYVFYLIIIICLTSLNFQWNIRRNFTAGWVFSVGSIEGADCLLIYTYTPDVSPVRGKVWFSLSCVGFAGRERERHSCLRRISLKCLFFTSKFADFSFWNLLRRLLAGRITLSITLCITAAKDYVPDNSETNILLTTDRWNFILLALLHNRHIKSGRECVIIETPRF